MRAFAAVVMVAGTVWFATTLVRAEDVTGTWVMENGKVTVRLDPCDGNLCGTIVAMKKPLDKHGNPKRDKHNPDPALRSRPVIGLTIIDRMKPDGEGTWTGEIYNPDDGHTYTSYMTLADGQIRVKGCVLGILCEKVTFRRVD
jgi:uncharacterized protein (DUF2147 family)